MERGVLVKKTWSVFSASTLFFENRTIEALRSSLKAFVEREEAEQSVTVHAHRIPLQSDGAYNFPNPIFFSIIEGVDETEAVLLPKGTQKGEPFASMIGVMLRGKLQTKRVFRLWLHQHFDCDTCELSVEPYQLAQLTGTWLYHASSITKPLQLKYKLGHGIKLITVTIDPQSVQSLLEIVSNHAATQGAKPLGRHFLSAVQEHVLHTINLDLSNASLESLATADGVISSNGKVKILQASSIELIVNSLAHITKRSQAN